MRKELVVQLMRLRGTCKRVGSGRTAGRVKGAMIRLCDGGGSKEDADTRDCRLRRPNCNEPRIKLAEPYGVTAACKGQTIGTRMMVMAKMINVSKEPTLRKSMKR